MLTTKQIPEMIDSGKKNSKTGQTVMKPNVVISYNAHLGGVDLLDQRISAYPINYNINFENGNNNKVSRWPESTILRIIIRLKCSQVKNTISN